MNELTDVFKHWWVALIFGILAIALGIFMFMYPIDTYVILSYVFAVYFILYGVSTSYITFKNRELIPAWGWSFAFGIFTIILGCMLFIPGMAVGTFVYYVSFSVMFMGINCCAVSFSLKDQGDKGWGWTLVLGILTIVLSFIMLNHPLMSIGVISIWAAIMFIMLGCTLCGLAYRLSVVHSAAKKLEQ
ncbi:MAG: HdeD family acid-resistance protein [Eubacteriaceae bacterium]|jgi:uncharacterized membrane protein HdeD (DUF308 family)